MNVFEVSQLGLPPQHFCANFSVNSVLLRKFRIFILHAWFRSLIDGNIFDFINSCWNGIFSRSAGQEIILLCYNKGSLLYLQEQVT